MDLGLSPNESKIYLSLLETGFSTATKIAESSGIHRVNVYDSVKRLKEEGLVGEVSDKGKRCYQAASPEALRNLLKEKEIKLNKVIPQLMLSKNLCDNQCHVEVYEGYPFIRNMFLHFLELKEDILDMHVPKFVLNRMGKDFQETIHVRRAKQKQYMYHLYSKEAIERIKFLNTLPYTEAKCLNESYDHNVTTTICGEEVAIQIYSDDENKKPMTIIIKNQQIAKAYRDHFFIIWEKAFKP